MGTVGGTGVDPPAMAEGTGLVMVEVARFFSPALEAVAAGVEAGRVTSIIALYFILADTQLLTNASG